MTTTWTPFATPATSATSSFAFPSTGAAPAAGGARPAGTSIPVTSGTGFGFGTGTTTFGTGAATGAPLGVGTTTPAFGTGTTTTGFGTGAPTTSFGTTTTTGFGTSAQTSSLFGTNPPTPTTMTGFGGGFPSTAPATPGPGYNFLSSSAATPSVSAPAPSAFGAPSIAQPQTTAWAAMLVKDLPGPNYEDVLKIHEEIKNHSPELLIKTKDMLDDAYERSNTLLAVLSATTKQAEELRKQVQQEIKHAEYIGLSIQRLKSMNAAPPSVPPTHPHANITSFSLHQTFKPPSLYFWHLLSVFEKRMQEYARQIEEIDQYLTSARGSGSASSRQPFTPALIREILQNQYQSFMAVAAAVATLHETIAEYKDKYRQLVGGKDPFAESADVTVTARGRGGRGRGAVAGRGDRKPGMPPLTYTPFSSAGQPAHAATPAGVSTPAAPGFGTAGSAWGATAATPATAARPNATAGWATSTPTSGTAASGVYTPSNTAAAPAAASFGAMPAQPITHGLGMSMAGLPTPATQGFATTTTTTTTATAPTGVAGATPGFGFALPTAQGDPNNPPRPGGKKSRSQPGGGGGGGRTRATTK